MKMENKRGMELAVNTLVIIVLSILVLIALLLIWNQQTGIFSEFIGDLIGKTNVDSLVVSCNSLASQNAVYEYCCAEKKARYKSEGKIIKEELTCSSLVEKSFTSGRINKLNCENIC